jgi:hypothetical protein
MSYTIDLVSVLGTPNAYIGFTSGTGASGANHDIVNWGVPGQLLADLQRRARARRLGDDDHGASAPSEPWRVVVPRRVIATRR